jgi:hypothetical protein
MALKKINQNKEIYVRIDRVFIGKTIEVPGLIVNFYNKEDDELSFQSSMHFYFREENPDFFRFTPEALSSEGNNPLKAGYEYLKTLPQFFDFEDC